jgi:hypothetical protein
VTTALNLVIASQATLRVAHAMESRQFCTLVPRDDPRGARLRAGAHAGILCVDCHVGEGAIGLVQSKLQGSRQLLSVLRGSVAMPIQGAIEAGHMVPSEQTCEGCHWKAQPAAANLKLIQRYAEDEANTPKTTLLTMNVGGRLMGGIHGAHHGEGVEIRFVATDARRQEIPLVEYHNSATGESRTYVKGRRRRGRAGEPAADHDAVLRLPQPRRARLPAARSGRRPRHHAGPDLGEPAVRQEEGDGDPEGELREQRRGGDRDSRRAHGRLRVRAAGGLSRARGRHRQAGEVWRTSTRATCSPSSA